MGRAPVGAALYILSTAHLGISNDVDEQDVADLQPDLFFNLGGHVVKLRKNNAIHNWAFRPPSR
jgi:hypothetical protein